jgi:hypothetical protein
LLSILIGLHPDLLQERVRHLAKERFDQIEPRTMLGRVHAARRQSAWAKG